MRFVGKEVMSYLPGRALFCNNQKIGGRTALQKDYVFVDVKETKPIPPK